MSKRNLSLFLVLLLLPAALLASSHREAPLITEDPAADATDVYVFRSPDAPNTVTFVANYYPFANAQGGPNFARFSDNVLYEIHIDNNGDAKEDITYQFRFRTDTRNGNTFLYNTGPVVTLDSANLNVRQFYSVTRVNGPRRASAGTQLGGEFQVAPWNIGPRSTPNYEVNLATPAINTLPSGGKVFCGPRDDPFFVDLGSVFDLLALRPIQTLHLINQPGNAKGIDGLKGYNVMSIVLQVPISDVAQSTSNQIIGVWSTSSRSRVTVRSAGLTPIQTLSAPVQVSRLGMPLVNEVVIPLAFKDFFNSAEPAGDLPLFNTNETFKNRVLDPEAAKLIPILYPGVTVPPAPRNDILSVFLTGLDGLNKPANVVPSEMLRINLATPLTASPNRMGALAGDNGGFPNGRRLADDIVDIELQVVAGVLVPGFNKQPNNQLTDGVDANDSPFLSSFPYLASPHSGYDSTPQGGN